MILTVTMNAAIDKRYVVKNFEEGQVNRVISCTYTPGGKGLNVSKPASIAGAKVVATGLVGGHAGAYIEDALKKFGIKSEFYHMAAESRSCVNIWNEDKKEQTEFLEPGFTVMEKDLEAFMDKFRRLVPDADVVTISGSVPKGLDGCAYERMVKIVKDARKKVILDTSGTLLEMGILAKPTMVKPNIDEIRMLTGSSCDTEEELIKAAKKIYETGIEVVVISLGGEGSILVCDSGVYKAKVPKIDVVNTVGCGDSMIAGFAFGFERGLSIVETYRLASAVSVASALREETGIFMMEDMERILPEIEIQKIFRSIFPDFSLMNLT